MSAPDEARPPRPSLPPLLLVGLAIWAVAALLWPMTRTLESTALVVAACGGILGAALIAVCGIRRASAPVLAVVALGGCAAVAFVCLGAWVQHTAVDRTLDFEGPWTCTLTADAKATEFGWSAEARVRNEEGLSAKVRLNLPKEEGGLLCGDRLVVASRVRQPDDAFRERWWNAGVVGSLAVEGAACAEVKSVPVLSDVRKRALGAIARFGGDEAGLLQALVCGFRPTIEQAGSYEQFKTVGLAHLVAVSGAHLSIVAMFAAQGLRLLRLGRKGTAAAMALFLIGYVGFTGMPVSALRASVMAATGLIALVVNRRASALNALGACIALFVGLDPPCGLSASFALSAGSTLGIVVLAPLLGALVPSKSRAVRTLIVEPLTLTLASALATQPYAAALFAQVPLLAPIANIIAAPLFAIACTVGFAATLVAVAAPPLAGVVVSCAACAAAPLHGIVDLLSRVPGSCLPVDVDPGIMALLSVVLVGGLWAWWPTLRPRIVAMAAAVALAAGIAATLVVFPQGADEIVMLNVGQGDAFLVRSEGSCILIDTGNQDTLLREACARQGIHRLDRVVVTHPDDDHCGSLSTLGDVARVGGLVVAADLLTCPCRSCEDLRAVAAREGYPAGVEGLEVGDSIQCGRFRLEVVWPPHFSDEGGNADSLCFVCSYDGDDDGSAEWTALFCGDAEVDELSEIASILPDRGIDVLKVGHHGSRKSLDAEVAARLSPELALIGVGEANRYGHPSKEALEALESAGARVLCSDEAGDVNIAFSVEKLAVRTQNVEAGD